MSIAPKADAFVCVYSCTHCALGAMCALKADRAGATCCPAANQSEKQLQEFVVRLVLSVALFLFCSLCLADEWEDALQLDSWDEVQAYWQIEQLPRMVDLSTQPHFIEYLHVVLETILCTACLSVPRVVG